MKPTVWHHLRLCPHGHPDETIDDAAIAVDETGTIVWLGAMSALPHGYAHWQREDLHGAWVTPGLVDCHTHLVYGGTRADEFAQRLAGVSYEEIARQGGGIVSTVRATRAADETALFVQAAARLQPLLAEGVTAIEIKSGYGPTSRANARCCALHASSANAFRSASTRPSSARTRCRPNMRAVRMRTSTKCATGCCRRWPTKAVDAVDVFCERIGFSLAQTERVFEAATRRGLPVKLHAEQLSNAGGTALAARYRALSADHLEFLDEAGIEAMKAAGTVAVLLPGAYYFIRETQLPPIELLRKHGVPIALATDHNPGTSPLESLLLTLNMGCTLFRMTVPEVLQGVTRHAAAALGRADRHGALEVGRQADFAAWSVGSLAELAYWIGRPLCEQVVRGGTTVFRRMNG